MKRFRSRLGLLVAVIVLLMATPDGAARAETIRVGGSSGALGVMQLIAAAFRRDHPDVEFRFLPNLSTAGGLRTVAAGVIDLGLSSRALKEAEAVQGLVATYYGTSAFVIVVRPENPVANLDLSELEAIYRGERERWPDGRRVRLILNAMGDTNNGILRGMSPGMAQAVDAALERNTTPLEATDSIVTTLIEKAPGAIGASVLCLVTAEHRALKVLSLDGVMPSADTIASKQYRYTRDYYVVTRRDPSPATTAFVAFLRSEAGRAILRANGHA